MYLVADISFTHTLTLLEVFVTDTTIIDNATTKPKSA